MKGEKTMPTGDPNAPSQGVVEVEKLSGVDRQFTPEELQLVDGETQTITRAPMPLIPVEEPSKTEAPLPAGPAFPPYSAPITETGGVAAPAALFTYPILRSNRYSGGDTTWQELLRWDIPDGWIGDLSELAISSSDDAHTRYRIILANVDQNVPTDRATTTPWNGPWRNIKIPPGFTVRVDVMSTDGTVITVDGSITGSITPLPM
jgi:hypothetical protein